MLKIGIIGRGPVSNEYLDAIKQSSDFAFEGFSSLHPNGESGENTHDNFPDLAGTLKLIHSSDALFFPKVTYEIYHLIALTLKHSRHVLIGNPLNLDLGLVDDLFKLAEEANVLLKVIQTIPYHSVLQVATTYIRNPVYVEIRKESLNSTESLIENLYHSIQPAVYINQAAMKKLQAVGIPPNNGMPDVINARIEFNNGCVANITSSRYSSSDRFSCRIHQEKQYIDIDFNNHSISLTNFEKSNHKNSSDIIMVSGNYPFADELSCFAKNILSNSFHLNHSESGYHTYFISRKILEKISFASAII
jgi:predicted dehydrogenase